MTDLQDMLEAARKRVDAMTPEEREKMWEEQRASWVRAMTTGCEHGVLDFEQCPECRGRTPMTDMIPRAEADALVAAAFEAAAKACSEVHTTGRLHGPQGTVSAIRALTPDDARAALEAMLADAEKRRR